jgi:hypothetical protein
VAQPISISTARGEIYLRSTAPGLVIASWYPRSQQDPDWPGSIIAVSEDSSFPMAAWEAGDDAAVREWIAQAHPGFMSRND